MAAKWVVIWELTGVQDLDLSMSLFSHSVSRLSLSASSCSLQLNSLSSCFKRSSVSSISHLTDSGRRKFDYHTFSMYKKTGNNHQTKMHLWPRKATTAVCNSYLCQQVVLSAKQYNPLTKPLVWLFINRYVKEGQNAPLLNPSALKSHISPCQNLSTHTLKTSLLLELISLPLSWGAFPECLTLPLPPPSAPRSLFPLLSVHFWHISLHALQLFWTRAFIVCFLQLSLLLQLVPLKRLNLVYFF